MNNLFVQDRMARDNADYEGSGKGNGFYDQKADRKEKLDECKLPFLLAVFLVGCILLALSLHCGELSVKFSGTAVTVPYSPGSRTAKFIAPDGNTYYVDTSWAGCKKEEITLYYKGEDYKNAIAMTEWWLFWAVYFGCGMVLALLIRHMYRMFHNSGHAVQREGKGKFED